MQVNMAGAPRVAARGVQEVSMMRKVRHKNIVQFIGACTRKPNLCIVFEFMSGGSVYDWVRRVSAPCGLAERSAGRVEQRKHSANRGMAALAAHQLEQGQRNQSGGVILFHSGLCYNGEQRTVHSWWRAGRGMYAFIRGAEAATCGRPCNLDRMHATHTRRRALCPAIAQEGSLRLSQVLKIAAEVARGMDYLHQRKIIHRDLKVSYATWRQGGEGWYSTGQHRVSERLCVAMAAVGWDGVKP